MVLKQSDKETAKTTNTAKLWKNYFFNGLLHCPTQSYGCVLASLWFKEY